MRQAAGKGSEGLAGTVGLCRRGYSLLSQAFDASFEYYFLKS